MRRSAALLLALSIASLLAVATSAGAAEVRFAASTGLNSVIAQLVSQFESSSGHKLSLATPAVAIDIKKRIEGGEAFDVAILSPELASELVKAGKVAAGTNTDFVRFGIGVAVRAGAPKPGIATSEALKQAVVNAKSITYTRGGSGVHFESLLSRWGNADQVNPNGKKVGGGPDSREKHQCNFALAHTHWLSPLIEQVVCQLIYQQLRASRQAYRPANAVAIARAPFPSRS
jgi:molybdate transport system substrate-binding protein